MAQTPSLQELLTAANDYALSNVYTSIPGIIVSVKDLGELRVDVQPTINIRSEDGTVSTPRPPILNVPLKMPVSNQGGLTYPVAVGQPVWLDFSMRGLEKWKRGNGRADSPSDMRMFDQRDCVAEPVYPFGLSPNDPAKHSLAHDTSDVVLFHNLGGAEVEIRLKPNGEVIVNSPVKVTINSPENEINGNVTVNGDFKNTGGSFQVDTGTYALSASEEATQFGTMSHSGSFVLNGIPMEDHRHGGVVQGGDVSEGPTN